MSVLDDTALDSLRELGGDEFLVEVIDTFLADAPTLMASLHASLERGDVEELRRAAHTLKSNGQTFGAASFSERCRELEEQARSGELAGADELAGRIDLEYAEVEGALAALRGKPAS
jgi:HPt (histidine-containing phosphotransfer) domain-containing protein